MALTGQAKTDYQREYMRRLRSNKKVDIIRPVTPYPVRPKEKAKPRAKPRPEGLSANQWAYIQMKAEQGDS